MQNLGHTTLRIMESVIQFQDVNLLPFIWG